MLDQTTHVVIEFWMRMVDAVTTFVSGQKDLYLVFAIGFLLILISIVLTYLMRKLKR